MPQNTHIIRLFTIMTMWWRWWWRLKKKEDYLQTLKFMKIAYYTHDHRHPINKSVKRLLLLVCHIVAVFIVVYFFEENNMANIILLHCLLFGSSVSGVICWLLWELTKWSWWSWRDENKEVRITDKPYKWMSLMFTLLVLCVWFFFLFA